MFTLLAWFALLVYQLALANGLTWEQGLYPLPKRVVLGPGFSFNDNVAYVLDVRGETGDNPIDPAMYKLDTTVANPSWQKLPVSIPFTSYIQRDQSCKVGDKLYFHHSLERKLYIFDITTDTFIDNSNIPLSSCGPGSSSSVVSDGNNFVYIVGGQNTGCSAYVQQYDIANNQWNVLSTSAPYERWFWLNVALYPQQNRIYVFGGYQNSVDPHGDFFDVYYFDIDSNSWSASINTISMRRLEPIAYIPETDRIYIFIGGSQGVSIYNPNSNTETFSTNSPDTVCGSSTWSSAFPLNGRLQEFAGTSTGVNCRTEVIYTVEEGLCCGCSGVSCFQDRKCAYTVCSSGYLGMTPYNPDPYCCNTAWDSICVAEAEFVCNEESGN